MRRIALVTDRQHGLTNDDRLLVPVLQKHGFEVSTEQWDSQSTDWEVFDVCILRSCWDYHVRIGEFLHWLCLLEERHVVILNPIPTVRWNYHKRYLKDLEGRGISIVPTHLVEKSGVTSLGETFRLCGWDPLIVKPCISASSHRTHRVSGNEAGAYQTEFEAIVRESGALVQPFLPEIQISGEWSFIFFGREFSHAVLKRPGHGEFRTQEAFGGIALKATPSVAQIGQAERVLGAVEGDLLYARVDMVEVEGTMLLGELELIEPFLFFGCDADSPARFAQVLTDLLLRR